ncbi:lasso peptide biosynthesis B2 protein [Fortiea sp. LEGE XX443]|uniref:lasso peptide biosynthesis B2 protein n=1 Tax=Fortiea sp. LEGE XX443 TaxID=1828611 RepID=UPI001882E3C5|nr:lasso peptide biosynthesis B2 protein [Fortiea sp. LEGE XX443]MBE9005842.1 lasso peptide biosynthesis B2 protein [Fortiea sp. LEGE XX443]
MKQLHKLLHLTSSIQFLLTAFITMIMIRLGLKLLPWRILYQLVGKIVPTSLNIPEPGEVLWRRVVWAVDTVSRYMIPKPVCLARALVTYILLARQGYRTELCIGVAKNSQGEFAAHAWVESQEQVIIGKIKNLSDFIRLPSLYQKTV